MPVIGPSSTRGSCIHVARLGAGYLLLLLAARAQTSGSLFGSVTDSSGLAVSGAKVVARSIERGSSRETVTDREGQYRFLSVLPGSYRVTVDSPGLQSQSKSAIWVRIAGQTSADFILAAATRSESIEVSSAMPPLDPVETSNGLVLGDRPLRSLPVNGRDYARFSMLAAGAVLRTNNIADLSFNGLPTVGNQFSIDGIDASRIDQPYMANGYERGARLLTGSLETISEMRVQTSSYRAEYGRAAGTWVNIATRGGTNYWHGTLLEYFRNSAFDARDYFNRRPTPQAPFRFNNFGASMGGALVRDRLFVFGNYEGSRQRVGITGNGTVPSAALRAEVAAVSPALIPLLNLMPLGTSATANPRVDNYVTTGVTAVREDTGSLRVDGQVSARHSAYARLNFNDSRVEGPLYVLAATLLGPADRQDVPVRTINGIVHDQYSFSPTAVNEFTAGFQRWASTQIQNSPFPRVNVTGLGLGVGGGTRTLANQTSYQIGDTVSLNRQRHTVKFGGTAWHIRLVRRTADNAAITYPSIDDFVNNRASQVVLTAGNPGSAVWAWQGGAFVQDTWRARANLTIDVGLRYDYATPPYDPQSRARVFDARIGDLASPGTPYFETNRKNFAPRFGLAWQVRPRLLVRAGYGIFYQAYPVGYGIYNVPLNTLPGNTTLRRVQIPELSYPFDRFVAQGMRSLPTVQGFDWNKPDLYAQQWNATLGLAITAADALEVAWVGNRGLNHRRALNLNLLDPTTQRVPYPGFADVNIEAANGQSVYHSLQASWRRQSRAGIQFQANYVWSHAIDDVSDPGLFAGQPQSMQDWRPERGNGSSDVRHSATFASLYELPFGPDKRWARRWPRVTGGWQIATTGFFRTGIAATVNLPRNTFGNGNLVNQRPDAVVNADPYSSRRDPDGWLNPDAFRIPANGTFGNLGRNTVFGPGFAQVDASLLKDTPLGETTRLQFRAEVFNVLNRPNFAQPNTTFTSAAFGRVLSTLGRTLGFGTARQIQLALRLTF